MVLIFIVRDGGPLRTFLYVELWLLLCGLQLKAVRVGWVPAWGSPEMNFQTLFDCVSAAVVPLEFAYAIVGDSGR